MAMNKKAIIDAVYLSTGIAAKNPIPPSMWSYNDDVKDDPYDPEAAKKLLAEPAIPTASRRTCGPCPCSAPTIPTPAALPS
jgi:dipeptide transport system substrate-binding protein